MKRTIAILVIATLVLVALGLWAAKGHLFDNAREIGMIGVSLVLVGFAVYLGVSRLRSHARGERPEDELSRKIMTKASSLAYFISIYLWLFVMYISDKTTLPLHTLVGLGILGMAVVFLLCWIGVKAFGLKHE
jgi:hypothetical protein